MFMIGRASSSTTPCRLARSNAEQYTASISDGDCSADKEPALDGGRGSGGLHGDWAAKKEHIGERSRCSVSGFVTIRFQSSMESRHSGHSTLSDVPVYTNPEFASDKQETAEAVGQLTYVATRCRYPAVFCMRSRTSRFVD